MLDTGKDVNVKIARRNERSAILKLSMANYDSFLKSPRRLKVPLAYRHSDHDGNSLKECPGCSQDFTTKGGIVIHVRVEDNTLEFKSFLVDGVLQDTDGQLVANGFHSSTVCGGCDELLIDYDEAVVEHQIGSL